ncbi:MULTISPECIES: hypothetical protein [Pseudomonas]|uniref:Uncharacterized protein n=1 Tax=Pseudomonas juntendi TaxID=2666183 RepID=A0A7W2LU71_9PSED|nr:MULTISPECIES: hypothetical protein [Pseudomonas]NOY02631.1 hypothetical protein [Gammaproteobacteria bacterium]MBA6130570.1 hypothetical protein [Pseudomonas juntendi]MBA6147098.1 hypothetical protein [Pseudomonas juntendi]MCK2111817.1 hypothetical protein [Pseudomonas juntendi]MCK2114161.1 hypothetical protein [Pseudomonas juntendi]
MFIGIPTHFWVLPVACLVAYYGLKWSVRFGSRAALLQVSTYLLLLALAVLPNGIYALFPPAPDPDVLLNNAPLPNYAGRFYLDAFYVFSGWALSKVVKLKFR